MINQLQALWKPGKERVGVILLSGGIQELENIAENPWEMFQLEPTGFEALLPNLSGTWHTHPTTSANLSVEDYIFFQKLPETLYHYVIAQGEVRCYFVREGRVILLET